MSGACHKPDVLATVVNRLDRKFGAIAGPMRPAGITSDAIALGPARFEDAAEEIFAALAALKPAEGWIWRAGVEPVVFQDWGQVEWVGTPLRAEILCSDGASAHLDHQGGLSWLLRVLAETAPPADGPTVVADDVSLLGREIVAVTAKDEPLARVFHYSRYWTIQPDGAARLSATRFTGFGVEGDP